MPTTIFDVAEKAGVSISTVSRVLNGKDRVHPDTARRVLDAVAELGFRQNPLARALVRQRSETVGLVIPKVNDPFLFEIVRGVEDGLTDTGYSLLIASHPRSSDDRRNLEPLRQHVVDGIIAVAVDLQRTEIDELLQRRLPIVLIQSEPREGVTSFTVDNYGGACRLVEHLLSHHYRRFAYIRGSEFTSDSAERLRALRDTLAAHGLSLDERYVVAGDYLRGSGHRAMTELLALSPRPDVVFAANDQMASDAMVAIHERGLRVPDDIALAGFDDIPLASYLTPALTTVHQPTYELGYQAAEIALSMIKEEVPSEPKHVVLPTRLVVRDSCGRH